MFKKRTSRHHRRREVKTLQAQVISPRIAIYDARRAAAWCGRMLLLATLIGVACWGVWLALRKGLLENEEFRLREIVLNDNPVLDESRLFEVTGIESDASLFELSPALIRERLLARPEILSAKVTREFPGRLHIEVAPRRPQVWISCPALGAPPRSAAGGLLADAHGVLFECRPGLLAEALALPVIELPGDAGSLEAGGKIRHASYLRGMRLLREAVEADPGAAGWIDVIRQHKSWASELVTRAGTVATFGHEDIGRQMQDFLAAVRHAEESGRALATVRLIGRRNLPVTFLDGPAGPPAAPPRVEEEVPPRAIRVDEEQAGDHEDGTGEGVPEGEIPEPTVDPDLQELLER